jgi:muramoyltetrapeptide carboxypeptidase
VRARGLWQLARMPLASRQFTHRYLAPGARVELIAPAGPFDKDEFERGVLRLQQHYDVHYTPGIFERQGYLAGDDERRCKELQAALAEPGVAGIIAARGGYGVTRILARLEPTAVSKHAPLLVGFSDISALHALWARAAVGSVHGSMVARLAQASDAGFERWRAAVEGRFPASIPGLETMSPGVAEGVLLGGNLAVLTALIGTPHFPPLQDCVLFLEDVSERPYRVDRMLTTWRDAGVLAAVRGIALGAFEQADCGPDGVQVRDVLRERLSDLGIPVVADVPAGHIDDNVELPFGRVVTLDATNGTLFLHERRNT